MNRQYIIQMFKHSGIRLGNKNLIKDIDMKIILLAKKLVLQHQYLLYTQF